MTSRRARPRAGARLVLLALVAALLAAPAGAQPSSCTPLDRGGLVALLLGAPTSSTTAGPDLLQVAGSRAGTVVLLGGAIADADQVRRLVAALDDAAVAGGLPGSLIAVDEEGGRVARFGRNCVTTHLPSARQQAATRTVAETLADATALGGQLADLGVDVNLAPVLDLFDGDPRTVIGDRSYSADAATAGAYGRAFAEGMRAGGVATVGKHFPDHGMTTTDTHARVAVVDVAVETLRGRHLEPYRIAQDQLDAVMLSHLRIPALTGELPATLSPAAVAMVRDELGFDGLIVTDDLSMQAVAAAFDQPTAALAAVRAGVDLALLGSVQAAAAAHDRLLAALDEGELDLERVRQAARRVLRLHGVQGAAASCQLGLPPVAQARLVTGSDGVLHEVDEAGRRPLPDVETALARTGTSTATRYSDAELASLPLLPAAPSVRRFSFITVAEPGSRPLDVAVQRALAERPDGWPHVVLVAPGSDAVAAAGLVDEATTVLPLDPTSPGPGLADALAVTLAAGGRVSAVGPLAAGQAPSDEAAASAWTRFAEPDETLRDIAVARSVLARRGTPELVIVIDDAVDVGALLPWLAAEGIVVLRHGGGDPQLDAFLDEVRQADARIATVGLPTDAIPDATPLPTPGGRLTLTPALQDGFGRRTVPGSTRGAETVSLLLHGADDAAGHASAWALTALPLAARARSLSLPVTDGAVHPLDRAQLGLLRLVGGAASDAYLVGVRAGGLASLGRLTHYRR